MVLTISLTYFLVSLVVGFWTRIHEKHMSSETDTQDGIDIRNAYMAVKDEISETRHDPFERKACLDDFCGKLATVVADGDYERDEAAQLLSTLAAHAQTKKETLEKMFRQHLEGLIDESSMEVSWDNGLPADILVRTKLSSVTRHVSSDTNVDTFYVFEFSNPDVQIETSREHLNQTELRRLYFDASEHFVAPAQDGIGDWADWIQQFLEDYFENTPESTVHFDGARTLAAETLRASLINQEPTTELREAFLQAIPYVESEDSDVLQVPYEFIARVLIDYEDVPPANLHRELHARGLLQSNAKRVRMDTGEVVSLWQIRRAWVDGSDVETEEGDEQ